MSEVADPEEGSSISSRVAGNAEQSEVDAIDTSSSNTIPVNPEQSPDEVIEYLDNVGGSESEAPISERASASTGLESPKVGSPRVQFEKIKEEEISYPMLGDSVDLEEDHKNHRHHKYEHK